MRVFAGVAALVVVLALPAGIGAHPAAAKAFPSGCWKARGAGYVQGPIELLEGITVNVSSDFTFTLRVTKAKATGKMDYAAIGTSQKDVGSGVTAAVTISATASPRLTGTPAHILIKGKVHYQGKIELSPLGTNTALDFTRELTEPLTIRQVAKNKVSGGVASATAHWTAVRKRCR